MDVVKKVLIVVALLCGILPFKYDKLEMVLASEAKYDNSLYLQINQNLSLYNTDFIVNYEGNTKSIDKQLYSIMQTIKENDPYVYENITKWNANYSYKGSKASVTFKVDYLTNITQEQYVTKEIARLSKQLINPGMSDVEKIKAIHDYLIVNTAYSTNTKASRYTTYAVLTENKGVCQGYAFFMYRMLKESGFETKYVKGYAGGELHGWVMVNLNGDWYHIDPTWNDPIPDRKSQVRYKYFLVSDMKMSQTHTWDKTFYPSARSEKFSTLHVADNANTTGNQLYYRNSFNDSLYVMNMKTLRSTKVNVSYFNQQLANLSLIN